MLSCEIHILGMISIEIFNRELENSPLLEIFNPRTEILNLGNLRALRVSAICNCDCHFRRRKTVDTAGRSYGGPSEKFVGDWGGFSEVAP